MATQPAAPVPNGGTNHIGLRLGDKAFSLQSQQLVLIVVLLVVGFLAWERGKTTAAHLERLQANQASLSTAIHDGDTRAHEVFRTEFHALREALLARQVEIQEASSAERAALSQALAAHVQQTQGQQGTVTQCLEQLPALLQLLRQRLPGP